jgi:hypothetical protein
LSALVSTDSSYVFTVPGQALKVETLLLPPPFLLLLGVANGRPVSGTMDSKLGPSNSSS